jgi:hypothetical protein
MDVELIPCRILDHCSSPFPDDDFSRYASFDIAYDCQAAGYYLTF